MKESLDEKLTNFMTATNKSNIAIIIPLFGYPKPSKAKNLDEETLKIALDRAYTRAHNAYFIFVGDDKGVPAKIRNLLAVQSQFGNCIGVNIPSDSTYPEYIAKGMECALHETNAEYIVVVNPWIVMQHGAIDTIVDRVNVGDEASVVCGYDLKEEISPEHFEDFTVLVPKEKYGISFDLLAMKRYTAETLPLDANYKTREYLEFDIGQNLFQRGTTSIISQRVPIFPFAIDFDELVGTEDKEEDKQYFISKWRFEPQI